MLTIEHRLVLPEWTPSGCIVVTLLGALRKYGKKRGMAALCIGGGEATAMALESI